MEERRKKSGRNDCTLCSKEKKKKAAELRRDSLQSLLSIFSRH